MMGLLPPAPKTKLGNYFSKEIRILKILGISLTGDESAAYRIYSFVLLFTTIFMYPLIDTYEVTKHEFSEVANFVSFQVGGFSATAKAAVMFRNRAKFRKLLERLQQEPFAPNPKRGGDVEEKLITECHRITSAQTFIYLGAAYFTISMIVVYAITTRLRSSDYHDWKFTFGPLTVLNVTHSPNFEISLLYQNISIVCLASCFGSVDLLLAGVLAHISYQFKILQNYIRQLGSNGYQEIIKDQSVKTEAGSSKNLDPSTDVSIISWRYLQKSFRSAVRYHLAIIDLVGEVEKIFSLLLLVTFIITLAELCFSLYSSSVDTNYIQVAKQVGVSICLCFQVLLVCYWGEQVVYESQQVGRAVFESNFVGTDLRFQKSLILVMLRSQSPCKITAAKFTVISLTAFAWILRTSYSAFTVLRTTNKERA